ncbi:MAG: metalloregulator ArsR/SmtB family transcription factor, partial [bacterium]|nr:metalloregulator ArsR/SmtB family transcription factor [bacterium]
MSMEALNLFKALADETRLRLVHLFLHYELNVNEIVSIMKMGQSRISRHLKILVDGKILTSRRDGLWTFYSAMPEGDGRRFVESVRYLFQEDTCFALDLEDALRVLEERSKETTRFFDTIAEDWEKLKREIFGEVDLNHMILEAADKSETIVDLGCGTGDLLADLKPKAQQLIGVEKSPRMLETARARFADDTKIRLRMGELEHLPLREGEANLAVINMVLHHLREPAKAIREVHRILKAGDAFIIVDLVKHQQEGMRERFGDLRLGFSQEEIEQWLQNAGFKIKKIDY